jgi:hypothetical protein
MWERVITPRSLDGLKLFSICKFFPSSMPVEYMGRERKIWEGNVPSGGKDNDPLPVLGHPITASLHQCNLVLVPV